MVKTKTNPDSAKAPVPNASPKSVLKHVNPITQTRTTSIVSSSLFKKRVEQEFFALLQFPRDMTPSPLRQQMASTLQSVCNHFQCGFPYNWEEYAVGFCGDKHRVSASNEFNMSSGDSANKTLPFSFDDLPVTRIHDLLLPPFGDPENCLLTKSIFNDGNSPMKNVDSGSDETPVNQMETKVDYKFNNDNTILNSRDMTKEEHQKASCHSEMGTNVLTPTRVACKRSPSRLKNSGMKDEVVSSNSHGKSTYSDRAISSDATRNGIGGRVRKSASNPTNSFGEDNVTLVTADNPKVRQRRRKSLRKYCKLLIFIVFSSDISCRIAKTWSIAAVIIHYYNYVLCGRHHPLL
ncbi:hypothetical protein CFP56_034411 [Quercus suber]|uniref:SANTA domain-containing protein n=1 Tax=Quercus suber TaxID=58331 RepID=A0AAW0JC79_QUESU